MILKYTKPIIKEIYKIIYDKFVMPKLLVLDENNFPSVFNVGDYKSIKFVLNDKNNWFFAKHRPHELFLILPISIDYLSHPWVININKYINYTTIQPFRKDYVNTFRISFWVDFTKQSRKTKQKLHSGLCSEINNAFNCSHLETLNLQYVLDAYWASNIRNIADATYNNYLKQLDLIKIKQI